jgi:hypothetical protein
MGRPLELLVEYILKIDPVPFETRGIDVGNVITDHIHSGLMILKPGYAGKQ